MNSRPAPVVYETLPVRDLDAHRHRVGADLSDAEKKDTYRPAAFDGSEKVQKLRSSRPRDHGRALHGIPAASLTVPESRYVSRTTGGAGAPSAQTAVRSREPSRSPAAAARRPTSR